MHPQKTLCILSFYLPALAQRHTKLKHVTSLSLSLSLPFLRSALPSSFVCESTFHPISLSLLHTHTHTQHIQTRVFPQNMSASSLSHIHTLKDTPTQTHTHTHPDTHTHTQK